MGDKAAEAVSASALGEQHGKEKAVRGAMMYRLCSCSNVSQWWAAMSFSESTSGTLGVAVGSESSSAELLL